ncbi:MAG: tetratricopeptide repeat protein [Planctomycetaceae bacterium]|nr:tetratricopeptide repeat protein [Planctomycetaceae bacterium]
MSLLLSLVALLGAAVQAGSDPAQEAIDAGILAGKQGDHRKAIEHFQRARRAAPDSPQVLFYLGVAESKLSGRELRAIAWFGAYLTARPDAPNAEAVRKQIERLQASQQQTLERLIQLAEEAGAALNASGETSLYLCSAAKMWGEAGNVPAALKALDRIRDDYGKKTWKQDALASIADSQAAAGDHAGAKRTADSIQDPKEKAKALVAIALHEAEADGIAAALETAGRIENVELLIDALIGIARVQAARGDRSGAEKSLKRAEELAGKPGTASNGESPVPAARKEILEEAGKRPLKNAAPERLRVTDWTELLDDSDRRNLHSLNLPEFLDLPGHLASLPPSKDLEIAVGTALETAGRVLGGRRRVDACLKRLEPKK